ncbi:MAG: YgiT-type zinc finger protein [bacterium]
MTMNTLFKSARLGIGGKFTDESGLRKMKCLHCQGKMKKGIAPFHVDRNGYHLLLDTVPGWVCEQCGEAYFEESEVESIQNAIRGLDAQAAKLVGSA